jgi:hypothetical protein
MLEPNQTLALLMEGEENGPADVYLGGFVFLEMRCFKEEPILPSVVRVFAQRAIKRL